MTNQEMKDMLKIQMKTQVGIHHIKLNSQNGKISVKIARSMGNDNLFDELKNSQVQKSIWKQKYSILKHILKLHKTKHMYKGRFVPIQLLLSKNVNLK